MMLGRARDDRGVGTVLTAMLAIAMLCAGMVLAAVVSVYVGHQRAAVAADLAALAAASQGCAVGERVARAQGAVSVACFEEAGDAVVTVAVPAPPMLARVAAWTGREAPVLAASARAGASMP